LINNQLDFAVSIAKDAGGLQSYAFEKSGLKIKHKGRIDLVTEIDIACEKLIVDAIKKTYPSHGILTEEGSNKESTSDSLWIIDPLDGTTNFAHGFPIFAVSIALEVDGEIVLAVCYDPLRDELFTAIKGGGAFMNGKAISVSSTDKLENSLVATGFPYDLKTNQRNNINNFVKVVKECQAVRRPGAAVIDLCYVACGRFDAFWEQRLCPWDMAAGQLVVLEAGGLVTDMAGKKLDIYNETICVANKMVHPQLLSLLEP